MLFILSHYIQFLNHEHKACGGCLACGRSDPVFKASVIWLPAPQGSSGSSDHQGAALNFLHGKLFPFYLSRWFLWPGSPSPALQIFPGGSH